MQEAPKEPPKPSKPAWNKVCPVRLSVGISHMEYAAASTSASEQLLDAIVHAALTTCLARAAK